MKNKLLIITRDQKLFKSEIEKLNLPDLEIIAPMNESEFLNNIKDVNIILANPPIAKNYINMANNVVWLQSTFAGIDSLILDNLRKDYILTNVKNTYWKIMSESIC